MALRPADERDNVACELNPTGLSSSGPVIGIDLGTSFCCVAVWEHQGVEVIRNENGNCITPSCVAFTPSECLIGDAAKNQAVSNPKNTIFDVKRLIGRKFDDPIVQKDIVDWPFKVIAGSRGEPLICVKTDGGEDGEEAEKKYTPEEISAMQLGYLKGLAESYLDADVTDAVITVPAYFTQAQRQATKDAGKIAGLNVLRIVNEPTAAALAFGLARGLLYEEDETKVVLVFDLGGGTCDVSIMEVGRKGSTVRALSGDTHLGGVDFDNRLLKHVVQYCDGRIDSILNSTGPMKCLRRACVLAKHDLSERQGTLIDVDPSAGVVVPVSRATFEQMNEDLFSKCVALVQDALNGAKMQPSDISNVILVGGSTRIPKIQSLLKDMFGGRNPKKSVNADEAVACGAAITAAILTKENNCRLRELSMVEVTPLSLGVAVGHGAIDTCLMSTIIPRNSAIPAIGKRLYVTLEDNQDAIGFDLYEGERALCKDNHYLGAFDLDGFESAPAGDGTAVLTLSVDEDGLLHAEARNTASGRTKCATISMNKGRLTEAEIRRMVEEARIFKARDMDARKRAAAKNALDAYVRSVRRGMASVTGVAQRRALETRVEDVLSWLTSLRVLPTVEECAEKKQELGTLLS